MHIYEVLKRPLISEKTMAMRELSNHYAFEVDRRANRHQVKDAVEAVFPNVKVLDVRITNMPAIAATPPAITILLIFLFLAAVKSLLVSSSRALSWKLYTTSAMSASGFCFM